MQPAHSIGAVPNDLAMLLIRLTRAELRVLILLAEQLSTPQIAERIGVSRRTVEKHRESLIEKLGLKGKGANALLLYAFSRRDLLASLDDALRTPGKVEEYVEKYVALRK